jgi:hypothetical protein
MKRRRRVPTDEEVHEAVMQRLREMTHEDWVRTMEELSHAPEGVEDPWPPYDGPGANGSAPNSCSQETATPKTSP